MTIKRKPIWTLGGLALGLTIVYYILSSIMLGGSIARWEEEQAFFDVGRALTILHEEEEQLKGIAVEWASREDTRRFVETMDGYQPISNLDAATFSRLRLSIVLLTDSSGRMVYGKAFDLERMQEIPVAEGIRYGVSSSDVLIEALGTQTTAGLIALQQGPMLVASAPINGLHRDTRRGTLIVGRKMDDSLISRLEDKTGASLSVELSPKSALVAASAWPQDTLVRFEGDKVRSYVLLRDINESPALILEVVKPRTLWMSARAAIRRHAFLVMLLAIASSILVFVFLEKNVLKRVTRMSEDVMGIARNASLGKRMDVRSGTDELTVVAKHINEMLGKLEASQARMRESEEKYRSVVEQANDGMAIVQDAFLKYVNPRFAEIVGYKPADITDTSVDDYFLMEEAVRVVQRQWRYIRGQETASVHETLLRHRDGSRVPVEFNSGPIVYQDKPAELIVVRDITERKEFEERLRYLSLHDPLTGIYNRTFFEEELRRLARSREFPVTIVSIDVDGLKLINDTMGHDSGDSLLKACAEALKRTLRQCDVFARIGGDEFAVILPRTDQKTGDSILERMRASLLEHNQDNPDVLLSVSIGVATAFRQGESLEELFRRADDLMYRDKLYRGASARSRLVNTLLAALSERDHIAEGHAERLKNLCEKVGAKAGLSTRQLTDLALLAQVHDLGKVGISDKVLFKKSAPTEKEWQLIRQHAEKGYRIALSSPDLAGIADLILKHHEKWDGSGYPLGLKGEEIPVECRILAIADAYDAITNDRPYHKAEGTDKAIEELKRCSGTQFDPILVEEFLSIIEADDSGEGQSVASV